MVWAKTGFSGLVYHLGLRGLGEEWAEECTGLVQFGVVATVSWLGLDLVLVFGAENGVKTVVGPGVKVVVSGAPMPLSRVPLVCRSPHDAMAAARVS
jgi:hypothetical protein